MKSNLQNLVLGNLKLGKGYSSHFLFGIFFYCTLNILYFPIFPFLISKTDSVT